MATGKTHARFCRLIIDSLNISGDSRQVGSIGVTHQPQDVTAYADAVDNFTLGRQDFIFDGYQAVFSDTATTGSHIELKALEEYVTTFVMGIRAAPALGDPCIMQTLEQVSYTVSGSGDALIDAEFFKGQSNSTLTKAFGRALIVGSTISATTNSSSIDDGASSANGLLAHLHITVSDAGEWVLKIQDSANDADWVDLITFSADASAIAAESATVAGSVDRHLRFQATRTSGSFTSWVTVVRQ